jgi:hypothetical protein
MLKNYLGVYDDTSWKKEEKKEIWHRFELSS